MKPEELLINNLISRERIRPTLGDKVDIRILQDRLVPLFLSPGMHDLLFFAGKKVGIEYGRKLGASSLKEGVEGYLKAVEENNLAIPELVRISDSSAVIRLKENAVAYGLESLGQKVCWFSAGIQSGILSQATGKNTISRETKCSANGDPFCEFEIRVMTPSNAFAEAFKAGD